jgi:F-type H+-transporting ATPase subunit b
MQIDWFTVGAQTLNFLLLVWLLKRYLYGPILKAIDARESQVAKVLSDADTIKSDAELERNLFDQKNSEIDKKRDELLKEAKITARYQSEQIVLKAHKSADQISNSRLLALEKELQHYRDDIALKTLQEIYEVARKVLADLADVELEQQMLACFCKHLQSISPDEKTKLNKTIEAGNTELLLYSAFELTAAQIEKVDGILQTVISINTNKHYQLNHEVKTGLISGIELRSNGWKIAWNSEDYLNMLQTHIEQLLVEQRKAINNRTLQLSTRLLTTEDSA